MDRMRSLPKLQIILVASIIVTAIAMLVQPARAHSWTEWNGHTAITNVTMNNPEANEVWLVDSPHTLTCSTSTDNDRKRRWTEDPDGGHSPGSWSNVSDSVSHYWSGSGTFKDNDFIGTSVEYISPHHVAFDTITVYANDNLAADNNDAIVDEGGKSDSETVQVVGVTVHKVGFTGDHQLNRTPATYNGWGDGTVAIADPIYNADDSASEQAAKNHVCWTKGESSDAAKVRCRTAIALTEGSSFHLGAVGTGTWNWGSCSIAAGATESSEATCDHIEAWVSTVECGGLNPGWKFICTSGANVQRSLNSTSHSVYLTYGTPAGSSVTVKRINHVCCAADGESDLDTCAEKVFNTLSNKFDLSGPINGPSPIWRLHNPGEVSQCPGLADFVNKHFQMLGLGAGVKRYCHATAAGGYVADTSGAPVTRTVTGGAHGHANPTSHADYNSEESLIHWDGNTPAGPNAFEATVLFNGKHYALGVGIFNTAKEVVTNSFTEISWQYVAIDDPGPPATYKWTKCLVDLWVEVP